MKESDLYPPLKIFLENQGYEVKSEIEHCDVVAIRGDESPLIVELKINFNLTILLQAVDRLKLSDIVYIGLPKGLAVFKKQRKSVIKLVRMLGLGLIIIDPHGKIGAVDVLADPGPYKPRQTKQRTQRLLKEFQGRVGDPNLGGSVSHGGTMTAYRQKALAIAAYLEEHGETKAAVIAKHLEEPKTRNILYDDVYGWFDRLGKGIYSLSPRGVLEFPAWRTKQNELP
jgi:hypothetical protein